jgi:hypothetical protein
MIQEIVVYVILVLAVGYVIFTLIRKMHTKKASACGGCTGCDLKKDLTCNIPPKI